MPSKMLALLVLACGLIAASLAAGIFLVLAELRQPPASVEVEASLGETHLRFLSALARLPEARRGGALDQLDLAVAFPGFQVPQRQASDAAPAMVFIRLTPQDHSLDPAERPMRLYAPFLN